MNDARMSHKVILMIAVLLFFASSQSCAETAQPARHDFPHYSLLENGLVGLSRDHSQLTEGSAATETQRYELYAMADTSQASRSDSTEQRDRGAGLETWHKYLGYGTVLMAGITAASSSEEDFHESAAYLTAAGALSTLLTGYLAHSSRFDTDEGLLTRDNLHIMLGTLGAVILTTGVAIADGGDEKSHSGLGVAGGVLMGLAVIDIKW